MKALLYVSKRKMINRIRMLKTKPGQFLLVLFLIVYFGFIATMAFTGLSQANFQTPYWFVAALSVWCFYSFFINFATYAKRKGVIFYPSHTHFIFTAPISPKLILLYGACYNFSMNVLVAALFGVAGVIGFHLPIWKVALLLIVMIGVETILESGIIVLLYANERLSENVVRWVARSIYLLLGCVTAFGIWYFYSKGFSIQSVMQLIDVPAVQMLPIAGWNIAFLRWIVLGPTTLNVVCGLLYVAIVICVTVAAYKMKCQGNYYEDAAKFADDFAEMKARKNAGEMVMSIGKKRTFKRATITYKASGAKAIFYRQLLEYKKEKWFIFSYMTVFCMVADVLLLKVIDLSQIQPKNLLLLGIVAYLAILTGGYLGKWEKELKSPYLYLLPDAPWKKMWYATVFEHVKAAVDGAILVVPLGIVWKVPVLQIVCCWVLYIILQAIKLYSKVLIDSYLHHAMGDQMRQFVRMMVQMGVISIGIVLAFISMVFQNMLVTYGIILLYGLVMTVVIGALTTARFSIMEQYE